VRLTTPAPSRPACSVVVVTEPPSRASRPHRVSSPSRVAVVPLGGAAPAAGADAGAGAPRTLGLVGAVGRRGLGLGLAAGGLGLLLGGLLLDDLDGDERELAALVDLGDLHLDLLADVHDVLDVLDALAAVQLADLGDVQQAVLAGHERDERAEGGDLHDRAQVALADLRHRSE